MKFVCVAKNFAAENISAVDFKALGKGDPVVFLKPSTS